MGLVRIKNLENNFLMPQLPVKNRSHRVKSYSSPLNSLVAVVVGVLLLLIAGGVLWLSNAHVMPPTQKTELAIPDERIPH
jgi:hypothetical protein